LAHSGRPAGDTFEGVLRAGPSQSPFREQQRQQRQQQRQQRQPPAAVGRRRARCGGLLFLFAFPFLSLCSQSLRLSLSSKNSLLTCSKKSLGSSLFLTEPSALSMLGCRSSLTLFVGGARRSSPSWHSKGGRRRCAASAAAQLVDIGANML
ncbi:unnamed protein product, partial [Polarella glacialis]